jgi:hypothetical protein
MLAQIKYTYVRSYTVYKFIVKPYYEEPFVLLSQFRATVPSNVDICASTEKQKHIHPRA